MPANISRNSVDNIIISVNANIEWNREKAYIDKSIDEPLKYVIVRDTPQQEPQSNDCGMFVCAFVEFASHGIFDISTRLFGASNHRLRHGALLWNYVRRNQKDRAIIPRTFGLKFEPSFPGV
ncbi:hypothetical protein FXO38_09088 [Capsicum annuum]|uniref:Ubiquitin-like protease family profile domain-containing protein n=1 Tax=Capsicum annuum TaxID=4072 RepID=A0A2G3AFN5_CAPAN|nr:hypothetical protein FXO38_09088 [Capsicum annuum]KAF3668903.1 hypothetical protein FXO37_09290 [Capsicum annuum]PHT93020.1 hypothetical protein T459_00902 [Capsicum annuum]